LIYRYDIALDFCVDYLFLIGRVYVFYVGHVDKSSLYETLHHCNILNKHYHHHRYDNALNFLKNGNTSNGGKGSDSKSEEELKTNNGSNEKNEKEKELISSEKSVDFDERVLMM
jgi:hypothetical protein